MMGRPNLHIFHSDFKNRDKIYKGVIIVLLFSAIILGGLIIIKNFKFISILTPTVFKPAQSITNNFPADSIPATQSATTERNLPNDLTEDEKILLTPQNPSQSLQDKTNHYNIVIKLAVSSDKLYLNKCIKPSPLDIKLKNGQNLDIVNNDSKSHFVSIDANHIYKVGGGQTTSFNITFPYGPGAYGILCDGIPGVVSYFFYQP